MMRARHGIAKRSEVSWRRRFHLRISEAVQVLLLKHGWMERRDDQRRRKRDVWPCSMSRDDDIGSTSSSGMVGLNWIMACSVLRDDDVGSIPSSGMVGLNSIVACSVSKDDDVGSTWSSGIVGLNSIMACSVLRDDDVGSA